MGALPGEVAYQALCSALEDAQTVQRYRSKIVTVPGSGCRWWSGAVSGRGHGRFWLASVEGRDIVAIAHRFGFGLVHGPEALVSTRVLGHRCIRNSPSSSAWGLASPTTRTNTSAMSFAAPVDSITVESGIIPATRTIVVQEIAR